MIQFPQGKSVSITTDDNGDFKATSNDYEPLGASVSITSTIDKIGHTVSNTVKKLFNIAYPKPNSTVTDLGQVNVSGYGIPGTQVTLHFSDGSTATAKVNADGVYTTQDPGTDVSLSPDYRSRFRKRGEIKVTDQSHDGEVSDPNTTAVMQDKGPSILPWYSPNGMRQGYMISRSRIVGRANAAHVQIEFEYVDSQGPMIAKQSAKSNAEGWFIGGLPMNTRLYIKAVENGKTGQQRVIWTSQLQ